MVKAMGDLHDTKMQSTMWKRDLGPVLTALFFFSCVLCSWGQLEEIEKLAQLSGGDYLTARDRFLAAQRKPIVLPPNARRTWSAELLIYILNARIEYKEKFAEWDAMSLRQPPPISGWGVPHPLVEWGVAEENLNAPAQFFILEHIWKGGWTEFNKSYATKALLSKRIIGPLSTWQRVWEGADQVELRALALSALASDPSKWKMLHSVLTSDRSDELEKQAVFRGLAKIKDPRVREFVAESIDQWKTDSKLAGAAMGALAAQTDDKSRQDLYAILMDKAIPISVRTAAALQMAFNRRRGDVPYLEKLVLEAEKEEFPAREIGEMFNAYPMDDLKGLFEKVLRTSKSKELIDAVLLVLEFNKRKEDEVLLEILLSRKDLSGDVVERAAKVRKSFGEDPLFPSPTPDK